MTLTDIINNVIAGGLLGMLGQGIRIAVGLKKLNDSNNLQTTKGNSTEDFSTSRLVISIFIGFVAGALALLLKGSSFIDVKGDIKSDSIITIIAIGYSGADFIEGVFNTYISKFSGGNSSTNNQATTPASPGNVPANTQPTLVHDEANFSNTPAQG